MADPAIERLTQQVMRAAAFQQHADEHGYGRSQPAQMTRDGLMAVLQEAFRDHDRAGGGIDYPSLAAAVAPIIEAHVAAERERLAQAIKESNQRGDWPTRLDPGFGAGMLRAYNIVRGES